MIVESTPTLTFWSKRSAIWVGVLSSEYGMCSTEMPIVFYFTNALCSFIVPTCFIATIETFKEKLLYIYGNKEKKIVMLRNSKENRTGV